MATATFRLDFDTPTSGNGNLWITWSESVSGFVRGDVRASHPLTIGVLIPHGNNVYEYRFFLRNSDDRDDLYFTISANAVSEGNPLYTFPVQESVPGAPTTLSATVSGKTVSLSWTPPASDGGSAITRYEYRYAKGATAGGTWTTTGGKETTFTVTVPDPNTQYTFEVRAVNTVGNSDASNAVTARTEIVAPDAPRTLTGTAAATSVALGWLSPASNGGSAIVRYEYRVREGSKAWGTWTTTGGTGRSFTVTGLDKGTTYTLQVRAVNDIDADTEGFSEGSNTVTLTTDTTVPGVPTGLKVDPDGLGFDVSWTAPVDDGGTPITKYEYRYRRGRTAGGTWTSAGTNTSISVSGLRPNTQWTFEVRAVNAKGNSPAASASATTSQSVPSAPTAVTVVVLSGTTALLKWKSPGDVTGFQVNWAAGSSIGSNWRNTRGTQTSYLVTGLNRQTQYAFAVRGVNSAGAGARSQIKTARTPIASPHNALFFKECMNYIGGGVRVKKHGNPSQIIRSVADNDYGTFSQEKDYTVDISRNGAATRVDAFFVKCKGVSRHSGTPSGGSGSGWTNVTVPATVRNYEGRSVSTTVAGFQHHLLLLNSHFTAKSVRLQFQGSGVRIYEVMLLEFGLEIDANADFTEIAPDFVDRTGEIRSGPGGRLSYGAPIGAGRDTWEIAYGVEVVPGKTLLQTPQAFLYWRSENRNLVHAMEPSRFPWRLFPATFVGDRVPVRYRTDDKTAGEIVNFQVAEQ